MTDIDQKQSWWKRNWKWALPTGGCLTIIIVVLSFLGYGMYKVGSKLSEETNVFAFANVIMKVQSNKEVTAALGRPIEIKDEDYNPDAKTGEMNLDMQLQGQKSNGVLTVKATKVGDEWEYEVFTVTVDETGEIINLIDQINN